MLVFLLALENEEMCGQSCNHVEPFGKSKVNVVIKRAVTYLSKLRCLKSKSLQWIVPLEQEE